MRVAICGTRGIPACYGGFETFAEQLSTRLAKRGHEVTVYGRSHVIKYAEPEYRGVKIRLHWAPKHKYLETPVHSMISLFDVSWHRRADVILLCNAANSPFLFIPRLRGIPVAINVDGIERMRAKWNSLGRLWYMIGERCAAKFAPHVISDAHVIEEYYRTTYGRDSSVIAYGYDESAKDLAELKASGASIAVSPDPRIAHPVFADLGIEPGKYLLYVSRLEPENNAHIVSEAYQSLSPEERKIPLVIVGDAPYAREYIHSLKEKAGKDVIFAGYRFSDSYRALQLGAYAYVQATEVGGTHPALVEAMGFANCIIANGTPENVEVLGSAGLVYSKNNVAELAGHFRNILSDAKLVASCRRKAFDRAEECYSWELVCDRYEVLLESLIRDQTPNSESEKMGSKMHFDVDNAL